jgi:hypothetical protein
MTTKKGDIKYRLEIILDSSRINPISSDIDMLELYGFAIHSAKKIQGFWTVYNSGDLVRPTKDEETSDEYYNIELHRAVLDIDSNVEGLINLDRVINSELDNAPENTAPYIIYQYNSSIEDIKVEKGKYYIESLRFQYLNRELIKRFKSKTRDKIII